MCRVPSRSFSVALANTAGLEDTFSLDHKSVALTGISVTFLKIFIWSELALTSLIYVALETYELLGQYSVPCPTAIICNLNK
jgi:hypothetical protein